MAIRIADVAARCVGLLFACLLVNAVPTLAAEPDDPAERERRLLEQVGVERTAEGAIMLLGQLRPSEQIESQVTELIKQLGHNSFFVRQRATKLLLRFGHQADSQLVRAANGFDIEVGFQSRRLLQSIRSGRNQEMVDARILAALGILARERHPNSTATILRTIPVLERSEHLNRASEALWFAVSQEEIGLIRTAMQDQNPALRAAAIPAFELVAPKDTVKEINSFLTDHSSAIRLAAARALIDREPARCLAVLSELLDAQERAVKLQAAWLISRVLGEREDDNRELHFKDQVELWKNRLATLNVSDLQLPLEGQRLEIKAYQNTFREEFATDAVNIENHYGELKYETTVAGARASVSQGIARLHGDHNEGDQRLFVTSQQIVGHPLFRNSFEVSVDIGGEEGGAGAYHVGISIGNLRFLFHPGYRGGGYRVERVDNREYMIGNQQMPFTPMTGMLHKMQVTVQPQKDERVRLKVSITNPQKPQQKYVHTLVADSEDIGPLTRVALARSGRNGGAALFGSLMIDTSGIEQ